MNGQEFRAVSVRTTTTGRYNKPPVERLYHVLAVVHLVGNDREILLDASELFFIPQPQVARASDCCANLGAYACSAAVVGDLFGTLINLRA